MTDDIFDKCAKVAEIYGWRGDDPFLSRLNAEEVEIARKSGSNMYVHLKDYERLRAAISEALSAFNSIDTNSASGEHLS